MVIVFQRLVAPLRGATAISREPDAMIVRSLFFAQYREFAGGDEITVELPEGASVADLVRHLRGQGDGLSKLPASPVTAVNMDYAPAATPLRHGDEVAFIPPVAGG